MNFFFSINSNDFNETTLTIPKFQNRVEKNLNCYLFSASILNNQWIISQKF